MKSIFGDHVFSELSVADITFLDQKIVLQILPQFFKFSLVLWKKYSLMLKVEKK